MSVLHVLHGIVRIAYGGSTCLAVIRIKLLTWATHLCMACAANVTGHDVALHQRSAHALLRRLLKVP